MVNYLNTHSFQTIMLAWFQTLSPGEKCAALAIVDDPTFIRFYIGLIHMENDARDQGVTQGSYIHAKFAIEYLEREFEQAKSATRKNRQKNGGGNTSDVLKFKQEHSKLSPMTPSWDSILDSARIYPAEIDSPTEFEDPFDSCEPISLSLGTKNSKPQTDSLISHALSNSSAELVQRQITQSTVATMCREAMRNAASRISKAEADEAEHFLLSDRLHKDIVIALGSSTMLDCLFLQKYAADDGAALVHTFRVLSNHRMFQTAPSPTEVKAVLSGRTLPNPVRNNFSLLNISLFKLGMCSSAFCAYV